MSSIDPAAIGAAVTQGITDAQDAQHRAQLVRIQQAAAAAAGLASVETMKDSALVYIRMANASTEQFTQGHLRVYLQTTYPAASAADIEAAIVAAEGSL